MVVRKREFDSAPDMQRNLFYGARLLLVRLFALLAGLGKTDRDRLLAALDFAALAAAAALGRALLITMHLILHVAARASRVSALLFRLPGHGCTPSNELNRCCRASVPNSSVRVDE